LILASAASYRYPPAFEAAEIARFGEPLQITDLPTENETAAAWRSAAAIPGPRPIRGRFSAKESAPRRWPTGFSAAAVSGADLGSPTCRSGQPGSAPDRRRFAAGLGIDHPKADGPAFDVDLDRRGRRLRPKPVVIIPAWARPPRAAGLMTLIFRGAPDPAERRPSAVRLHSRTVFP